MRLHRDPRSTLKAAVLGLALAVNVLALPHRAVSAPIDSPLNGSWAARDIYGRTVTLSFTAPDYQNGVVQSGNYVLSNTDMGQYEFSLNFQTGIGQIVFYPQSGGSVLANVQIMAPNQMVVHWSWGIDTVFVR